MLAQRLRADMGRERTAEWPIAVLSWCRTRLSREVESNKRQPAGQLWLRSRNVRLQKHQTRKIIFTL